VADAAAFCAQIGDGGSENAAATEDAAPEAIKADVTTMAEHGRGEIEAGMTGGPSSDDYFAAATSVGDYMADNCGYQVIDVKATDYEFDGIPADAETGMTLIRITNDGTEYHEVAVQRVDPGERRSIQKLLALPEADGGDLLDYLGHAFAPPGMSNWTVVNLVAGRHVALCYVPTGATPEALRSGETDAKAPSHAMKGMVAEMQVS
jgi:hypothetical protein